MNTIESQKLILGTVKLGLPKYGLRNSESKLKDSARFLREAQEMGITHLDTAQSYGDSEIIIGSSTKGLNFEVSSKISNLQPNKKESIELIRKSVLRSIKRLNVQNLHICYLHQNDINIICDKYIQEGLMKLKQANIIKYLGASIYSQEECYAAINSKVFDFIQFPVNLVDTSIYHNCVREYSGNIRFIARSIYLQGLLIDSTYKFDKMKYSNEISNYLKYLEHTASKLGVDLSDLARSFVYNLENIDAFIIGTTNIKNLNANLCKFDLDKKTEIFQDIYLRSVTQKAWSNPRNW